MLNLIKSMKKPKQREDVISLRSFERHFRQKFTDKQETSSFIEKKAVGGFDSYCRKITEYKIKNK